MEELKKPLGFKVHGNKKHTYFFKNNIIKKYEQQVLDNTDAIAKYIGNYLSKVSSILSTRGPSKRIPFYISDKDGLFNVTKIDSNELLKAAKDGNFINMAKKTGQDYKTIGDKFYLLCTILSFIYYKNKDKIKYKTKDAYPYHKLVTLFLSISIYSWIYIRQFQFDPDEAIMDYTIDNINNKYIIKRVNNIFELNTYWVDTHFINMEKNLLQATDIDIIYFLSNLFSRISQSIVNIAQEFYKNYENKKRSDTEVLIKENEEGDTYLNDVRNISNDIEVTSRKIQIKFISDTMVDLRLLELACSKRQVSKSKMTVIITKIRESDDSLILELFQKIISYYLETSKSNIKTIKSQNFISKMLKVYSISNTTNTFKLRITEILDELFKKYSKEYVKSQRAATLSSMRSSLYTYFILYISKNIE